MFVPNQRSLKREEVSLLLGGRSSLSRPGIKPEFYIEFCLAESCENCQGKKKKIKKTHRKTNFTYSLTGSLEFYIIPILSSSVTARHPVLT